MRRIPCLTPVLAVVMAAGALAEPDDGRLERLFPQQASLETEGSGMVRLLLPPEVLAACRPDLSDVRIVDAAGREVPYLVDSGLPFEAELVTTEVFTPGIITVWRETVERENAPDIQRERYELGLPGELPLAGRWDLVVSAPSSHFVRRLTLSTRSAVGEPVPFLEGASIFRLARPAAARTRLALPPLSGETLVVDVEGEEGFFLEPAFRLESSRVVETVERARIELIVAEQQSVDGRTEIELMRPRGLVADELIIETATGSFSRRFEVWDEGVGSRPVAIGAGVLFRLETDPAVERLHLELDGMSGDRLRLVVDDGDSPPLRDVRVLAAVRRPALIFSYPANDAAARLLFGGARARRPRYDLAGLLPSLPARGEAAELAEHLYDPARMGVARLGELSPNPAFDPEPALAFAMRPGSTVDSRVYSHRQVFRAEPSPEGLIRVRLDLEALAVARADLADVRIVDDQGRQWAYLIAAAEATETRRVPIRKPTTEKGVSAYEIELPVQPAAPHELILHSRTPYFDRRFTVTGRRAVDGSEDVRHSGRLTRGAGDPRPLRLELGAERITRLELAVVDGDDAVLDFDRVDLSFSTPDLYLAAPAGRYALLLGHPDGSAPSYELARIRDVVLAVPAAAATLGRLTENPEFSTRARLAGGKGPQTVLLWSAIVLVVLVLGGMTLRLARQADD